MAFDDRYQQFISEQAPTSSWREEAASASANLPSPSFWEKLGTESRLAFMARKEVLIVLAMIAGGWAVFVSVRAVQSPSQTRSTAAEITPVPTPILTQLPTNTPLPTPLATTPLQDNPFLLTPTPTPRINPWAGLLQSTLTPSPTPRVNPWADLIPTVMP